MTALKTALVAQLDAELELNNTLNNMKRDSAAVAAYSDELKQNLTVFKVRNRASAVDQRECSKRFSTFETQRSTCSRLPRETQCRIGMRLDFNAGVSSKTLHAASQADGLASSRTAFAANHCESSFGSRSFSRFAEKR